jgi:hypothetical protein
MRFSPVYQSGIFCKAIACHRKSRSCHIFAHAFDSCEKKGVGDGPVFKKGG